MWNYEKRLQYPVNITKPNAKIAQIIMSQYGGPDGEMGASMRYLSQRYATPNRKVVGILTDIGTEELAHLEMVATIVRQLTKGLSAEEAAPAGKPKRKRTVKKASAEETAPAEVTEEKPKRKRTTKKAEAAPGLSSPPSV